MLNYVNLVIPNQHGQQMRILHWTYTDSEEMKECNEIDTRWGYKSTKLWAETIDRVLLADKDIEKILGVCDRLKSVFAKRSNK